MKNVILLISLIFAYKAIAIGSNDRTIRAENITSDKSNQDISIQPTGTGNVVLKDYTGFLKAVSGTVSAQALIDLTTDVTGVLPNANGGVPQNGSESQVLTWVGGTQSWQDAPVSTTLDTKGQIQGYSTQNANIGPCTNDQILVYDIAEATGWKCSALPSTSPTTTLGDLIYNDGGGNASDTRLAIGANGQILTVSSGLPAWENAPVSTTLTAKGDLQTHDGTSNATQVVGNDGEVLYADSTTTNGLAWKNPISGISQAHFVGSLLYSTANCLWESTSATLASFPVDADCTASNIIGNVAAPDTKIPAIKILNPKTSGYYRVFVQGSIQSETANADTVCRFNITNGDSTTDQGQVVTNPVTNNGNRAFKIDGDFKFTTTTDKTIEIEVQRASGSDRCFAFGIPNNNTKFSVYYFPDHNSPVATQETELTTETDNIISFAMLAGGTVQNENQDWINGDCTKSGTNNAFGTCVFNNALNSAPNCSCEARNVSANGISCQIDNANTNGSQLVFSTYTSAGAFISAGVEINCIKGSLDYNKSATIVGNFENINDTNLILIEGQGNGGTSLTGGTTDVDFIEIQDNYAIWDGDSFTSPRDTCYRVDGMIKTSASVESRIRFYVDGVAKRGAITYGTGLSNKTDHKFSGSICLLKDEVFSVRMVSSATLSNVATDHWIYIKEDPTLSAIVKNLLAEASQTKCQTKFLSSDITTDTADITDLKYTGLTTGKRYKLTSQVSMRKTASGSPRLVFRNNSNTIARAYNTSTTGEAGWHTFPAGTFIASNSEMIVSLEGGATTTVFGDGTRDETWVELCQLPDTFVETTEW